jgi:hypothetical protein
MSGITDLRESPVPYDRLTELADVMQESINSPENEDIKGIVFLQDSERGGIVLFGYDDVPSGLTSLLIHMKALFQSQGKSFGVMTDQGVMLMEED